MEKLCRNCGEEKPLTEFYKHAQMADGYLNICRQCVRERVRSHRRNNESVREYDRYRAQLPHRKEARRKITERWASENPTRDKAHIAVNNAVRDGRLKKEPCFFCSKPDGLEAHHKDYSKPMDVIWLCRKCHRRLHALFPEHITDGEVA